MDNESHFRCENGHAFAVPGINAVPGKCPFCGTAVFERVTA